MPCGEFRELKEELSKLRESLSPVTRQEHVKFHQGFLSDKEAENFAALDEICLGSNSQIVCSVQVMRNLSSDRIKETLLTFFGSRITFKVNKNAEEPMVTSFMFPRAITSSIQNKTYG